MLTNTTLIRLIRESSLLLNKQIDESMLNDVIFNNRSYGASDFDEFKRDLMETATRVGLDLFEYSLERSAFLAYLESSPEVLIAFEGTSEDTTPVLLSGKNKIPNVIRVAAENKESIALSHLQLPDVVNFFVVMPTQTLVSDYDFGLGTESKNQSPLKRFFRLLTLERKEIYYILFYAIVVGMIGLVLPLGIQTTVELISGGVFFSSVYVLIGIVTVGVIVSGVLQIIQLSLVEYLQQRLFTRASLEFAFRIPRIRTEALLGKYAPELVNRFFDVVTIMKGLPKLLIDFFAAIIQIFFGLVLLSLYHPFFVFFSITLVAVIILVIYATGPRGLSSSIQESKYKYKIVQWLEELGRAINSFKIAGTTDLPIRKTDSHVNNYLKYRKLHFRVLMTQYSFAVFFKAAITGGLLIMGSVLVVNREITLGQFVAAEVIIILVIAAVEKVMLYMDVVYDTLTAVDKVAQVTDLPLEKPGGIDLPKSDTGYQVAVRNLYYKYPETHVPALKYISLMIEPGERVCLAGPGGSGKTTLVNILSGLTQDFEGSVAIDDHSIRDLDLAHLRDKIGKNISQEEIFDGTLLENITVGKSQEKISDVIKALKQVHLDEDINVLPDGLNTHLVSGGKGLSNTFIHRLILARCIAKTPKLIILNDFFTGLKRSSKLELIQCVVDKRQPWTLIAVSNDPLIMAACDRVVVINEGQIVDSGPFTDLMKKGILNNYVE
jgi:ABC-type bacteriocin/lantibiotic exporter with double-glycine peptidase domain